MSALKLSTITVLLASTALAQVSGIPVRSGGAAGTPGVAGVSSIAGTAGVTVSPTTGAAIASCDVATGLIPGCVSTGVQTFSGAKTFNGGISTVSVDTPLISTASTPLQITRGTSPIEAIQLDDTNGVFMTYNNITVLACTPQGLQFNLGATPVIATYLDGGTTFDGGVTVQGTLTIGNPLVMATYADGGTFFDGGVFVNGGLDVVSQFASGSAGRPFRIGSAAQLDAGEPIASFYNDNLTTLVATIDGNGALDMRANTWPAPYVGSTTSPSLYGTAGTASRGRVYFGDTYSGIGPIASMRVPGGPGANAYNTAFVPLGSVAAQWQFRRSAVWESSMGNSDTTCPALAIGYPDPLTCTNSGAAAQVQDTGNSTGHIYYQLVTGAVANNSSNLAPTSAKNLVYPLWGYRFGVRVSTNETTNVRHWVGLSSGGPASFLNTDTPNTHYAAFRFSTAAGDTNWMFCTGTSNVSSGCSDTGIAALADQYLLETVTLVSGALVAYYVNGTYIGTRTTTLPTNAMYPFMYIDNANSANARHFNFAVMGFETN